MNAKIISIALVVVMMASILAPVSAISSEENESNLTIASAAPASDFEYTDDGSGGIKITRYIGPGGDVVVPSEIEGKPVRIIDAYSFGAGMSSNVENTKLISVIIPDSVTTIGSTAFKLCVNLKSVVIPGSVGIIDTNCFWWCSSLKSVTLGDGITRIGNGAFTGCTALTYIEIPASVTMIALNPFTSCTALTAVVFNGDAPVVVGWGFNCDNLKAYYYDGAADFETPEWEGVPCYPIPPLSVSITSPLADDVFGTSDVTVTWTSENAEKTEISKDGVNWEEVTEDSYALSLTDGSHTVYVRVTGEVGNTKQASVSFSVEAAAPTITDKTPTGTDVSVDSAISVTFSEAMDHDSTSIVVNGVTGTVTWNGNTATFTPSSYLAYGTEYTVTVNGKDLADNVLEEATWKFTTFSVSPPSDFIHVLINEDAEIEITGYTGPGGEVIIPGTIDGKPVTSIGSYAFRDCTALESVTIPRSVTTINYGAFYQCTALTAITIPDSVTTINYGAFSGCTALESVAIPDSVTTVGHSIFYGCTALKSIAIPDSVTAIGYNAFSGCSSLESVSLGNGIKVIQRGTFQDCTALTTMIFNGDAPTMMLGDYWAVGCTNLNVYYYEGATGFDTDSEGKWNGVPCSSIPPLSVSIVSPSTDDVLRTSEVTITWTSENAVKTEISKDGTSWEEVEEDSHELSLIDGSHTVYVRVTGEVGNTKVTSVSFTVDTITDVTAPTITDKTPTGSDAAIDSSISITFSEAMDKTSVTIVINGVTGTVTWNGNVATFVPSSALAYDTEYTVTVNGKDPSDNVLEEVTWTFKTMKDEGTISGVIKDDEVNAIEGVVVSLSNGMSTTTGADGSFSFDNVPSGSYTLTMEKYGFVTLEQEVSVEAGKTANLGTLFMEAADITAPTITDKSPTGTDVAVRTTISVTFSETMNKTSVSIVINGVEGTVTWNGNTAVFTPSSSLAHGTEYTVTVNGKDLADNVLEEATWKFTTVEDDVDVPELGSVSGIIKDNDGNVVAGAKVTLKGAITKTATTDSNGKYVFNDVAIGDYTLTVEKEGFDTYTKTVKVTSDNVADGSVADGTLSKSESSDDIVLIVVGIVAIVAVAALGVLMFMRGRSIKK